MSAYKCTVIYGYYEGNLKVWDEAEIEVLEDTRQLDRTLFNEKDVEEHIKTLASYKFMTEVGQDMRDGLAFHFVDSIEDVTEDDEPEPIHWKP